MKVFSPMIKAKIFFLLFLSFAIDSFGQRRMDNNFFTWENFVDQFGKEMVSAEDVYLTMKKNGLKDGSFTTMDFTFISDREENIEKLSGFLKTQYHYKLKKVKKIDNFWEVNGMTNEIPMTQENLLFWALDMYKRGYEFDSKFDAYGGLYDPINPKFPDLNESKEDFYFNSGVDSYNSGNLSGAIINWNLALAINPKNPDSYYSRAVVKNELYIWKSAMADYNKAIEIAPNFVNALTNRGSLKDENGDYSGAIDDFNKVLAIKGIDLENKQMAYFNRGNSKFNLGNKKEACEDWKVAAQVGAEYANEKLKDNCN